MDRLILLIGASGSGKTSVAREMGKEGYNVIESYTTRPKRRTEEWGHIFVNEYPEVLSSEVIAFVEVYEGVYYWATKDQFKGLGDSIYIVCPEGAEEAKKNLKDDDVEIITIYLQSDAKVRWSRMLYDRDKQSLDSRLVADLEKFKIVKCDYTLDGNGELDDVVNSLEEILDK